MRSLIGLLWVLGGGLAGCVLGAVAAQVLAVVTRASNREGAHGYLILALGFVGMVAGMVQGLSLYGQSAPAGQSGAYFKSGALGFAALLIVGAIGAAAFLYFQEEDALYDDNRAYLLMELRIENAALPSNPDPLWFRVEMETSHTTFPCADIYWSEKRIEGNYTIYPALHSPVKRSSHRKIFVHAGNRQIETFAPALKRKPVLMPDWSPWTRPTGVGPAYGATASAELKPMFELRYRVRRYNDGV